MIYDYDILVIDDEKIVLDAVVKICQFKDLSVDTATDGTIALEKIKSKKYKLLLCDIMMPEMDGFQFLNEFKKTNSETPIIVTSGYSTAENAIKALRDGAIDFIPKPFTFEELLSSITRAMNYVKFNTSDNSSLKVNGNLHPLYVTCPPQYYRLGYLSWVNPCEDGAVVTGIVNLLFELIDNPKQVTIFSQDTKVVQGNCYLKIISVDDYEHQIPSPVTGKIIEINEKIIEDIDLIGKNPYFEGWLYKIIPDHLETDLKQLIHCSSDRV